MIDLHCHILPGIDDGPETIEDSVALARSAVAAGIGTTLATPHVNRTYPNDSATIARLTAELSARLEHERIALEIRPGAEIAITRLTDLDPAELARLGLAGGPWLLIEPPFSPVATNLDALLMDLQHRGHRVLLAHPERCAAFHRDPEMLGSLVRAGILTSITAGSLVGRFGEQVRRFALRLAREGLVHNVASDAHDHLQRPPGMAQELEQVGLGPLAEWLTQLVPEAIMTGEQTIPPQPSVRLSSIESDRRSWWRRRARLKQAL